MFNFNPTSANLAALKSFAAEHNIIPNGDKRLLTTWRDAVAEFISERTPSMAELTEAAQRMCDFFEQKAAEAKDAATSEQAIANYEKALTFTRNTGLLTAKCCYITAHGLLRAAWLMMFAYALLTAALIGAAGRWGHDLGATLGAALVAAVAEANRKSPSAVAPVVERSAFPVRQFRNVAALQSVMAEGNERWIRA